MKRVVLAALVLSVGFAGVARAQDASGCDKFKWSISRERAWFAAGPKPIDAGAEVKLADEAYLVALVADDSAGFAVAPERAPKAGAFGGVMKFAIDKPGLYEVTLSDEGWVGCRSERRAREVERFHRPEGLPRRAQERALHARRRARAVADQQCRNQQDRVRDRAGGAL